MKIISLDQIKNILRSVDIVPDIESSFVSYSNGESVIPPVVN